MKRPFQKRKSPFDDLPLSQSTVIDSTRIELFLSILFRSISLPYSRARLAVDTDLGGCIRITVSPVDHPESIE